MQLVIATRRRVIDAGAHMIMIESEGITENVETWRTDVVRRKIIDALGTEKTLCSKPPIRPCSSGTSRTTVAE